MPGHGGQGGTPLPGTVRIGEPDGGRPRRRVLGLALGAAAVVPPLLAVALCLGAARRVPAERYAWWATATAWACNVAGDLVHTVAATPDPPFPSMADAFWLAGYPALFAAFQQHDLATLVTSDGHVRYLGVGLRASAEAERETDNSRGMRHRSAQRFSYDHPSTTIAVVSDDGPVTIFRAGAAVVLMRSTTAWFVAPGFCDQSSPASAATCGAAIDVSLKYA